MFKFKKKQEVSNFSRKILFFFSFLLFFLVALALIVFKGDQVIWEIVSEKSEKLLGSKLECEKVNWCHLGSICAQNCVTKDKSSKIDSLTLEIPRHSLKVHKFDLIKISNKLKKKEIRFPSLPKTIHSIRVESFNALGLYKIEEIKLNRIQRKKNQWEVSVSTNQDYLKIFGEIGDKIFLDFYLKHFPIYFNSKQKSQDKELTAFLSGRIIELDNFSEVDFSDLLVEKIIYQKKALNLPEILIKETQVILDTKQRKLRDLKNIRVLINKKIQIVSSKEEKNKLLIKKSLAQNLLEIIKNFYPQKTTLIENFTKGFFSGSIRYDLNNPRESELRLEGKNLSGLFLVNKQKIKLKKFSTKHLIKGTVHQSSLLKIDNLELKELNKLPRIKALGLSLQQGKLQAQIKIKKEKQPSITGKVDNLEAHFYRKSSTKTELFEVNAPKVNFSGSFKDFRMESPQLLVKSSLFLDQKKEEKIKNYLFKAKTVSLGLNSKIASQKPSFLLRFKPDFLKINSKPGEENFKFRSGEVFFDNKLLQVKKLNVLVSQNSEEVFLESSINLENFKKPKILSLKSKSKLSIKTSLKLISLFHLKKKLSFLNSLFFYRPKSNLSFNFDLSQKKKKIEIETNGLSALIQRYNLRLENLNSKLIFTKNDKQDPFIKVLIYNLETSSTNKKSSLSKKLWKTQIKNLFVEKHPVSQRKIDFQLAQIKLGEDSTFSFLGNLELPETSFSLKSNNLKKLISNLASSFYGKINGSFKLSDFVDPKDLEKFDYLSLKKTKFPVELKVSQGEKNTSSFVLNSKLNDKKKTPSYIKSTGSFNFKNFYFNIESLETAFQGLNITAKAKGQPNNFSFKAYTDPIVNIDKILSGSSFRFKNQELEGFLQGWIEGKNINFYNRRSILDNLKVSLKTDEFSNLKIGFIELDSLEFYLESNSGNGIATIFVKEGQIKNLLFRNLNGSFNLENRNLIFNGISLQTANGLVKLKGQINLNNQEGVINGEGKNLEIGQIARGLAEIKGLNGIGKFSFHADGHLYSLITKEKDILSSGEFYLRDGNASQVISIQKKLNLANLIFGGPFALNINSLLEVLMPENNGYYYELFGKWNLKEHKVNLLDLGYRGVNKLNLNLDGHWDRSNNKVKFLVLGSIPKTPVRVKQGGRVSEFLNIVSKIQVNNILGKLPILKQIFRNKDRYFSFEIKGPADNIALLNNYAAKSFKWESGLNPKDFSLQSKELN